MKKIQLVVSDDENPCVNIKEGRTLRVEKIELLPAKKQKDPVLAARLCGYGSGTCLALIELD